MVRRSFLFERLDRFWKLPLGWLLPLAFFVIGLLYIYAAPHFEASDSIQHIGMVKWIAEQGELPVQSPDHERLYGQEASQPPLYYILSSLIWRAVNPADFDDYFQPNPLVIAGVPQRLGNRNQIFYRQPYPPQLHGVSLALYLIRLMTLGMSAITVAAVYQSARTTLPNSKRFALLATSLTAFNPMFLFIGASVSNDNLVSMFTALIAWQMLLMLRDGFQTRRSLLIAVLVALASLSKLSGLVAGFVVALAGSWLLLRSRDWRGFITLGLAMLLIWLLLAGWWFARNLQLYGELFGTATMLANFGGRHMTLPRLVVEEFEGLRISYWALFGAFSILVSKAFYQLMDALLLLSGFGLILYLAKNRQQRYQMTAVAFLALLLAIGLGMLVWWTLQTTATTGRLLFPFITSISIMMALGLTALRIPALLVSLPMFAFAAAAPFVYIISEYDLPPIVDSLPATATKTYARWDDISLVGYELPPPRRWSTGDEIPVALYWQPLAQSSELQAFFITLINADGHKLATIDTFPGWGSLPPTWWQPNAIYRDELRLQIPPDADGFTTVQLHIGWYNWSDRRDIMPTLESGETATAFTLPVGAFIGGDNPRLDTGAVADGTVFGDKIRLNAWRFTQGHLLELEWQIEQEITGDWRVFAIVFTEPYQAGATFELLSQWDTAPPVPVGYLAPGETVITRHAFDLPANYRGEHSIYIGWYNDDLLARLTAPYPENMLPLPAQVFESE